MSSDLASTDFLAALRELATHLRNFGAPDWAERIESCASSMEQSEYCGVERYYELLGGMGSLNDLVLHYNGRWLTQENDKLQALLARVANLASALREKQRSSY